MSVLSVTAKQSISMVLSEDNIWIMVNIPKTQSIVLIENCHVGNIFFLHNLSRIKHWLKKTLLICPAMFGFTLHLTYSNLSTEYCNVVF